MQTNQVRKLNVIIQKRMMTMDQQRLLVTLLSTPVTTLTELSDAYYGARAKETDKITMRKNYLKKYLKALMLRLEYWGLPHVITITKEEAVRLTMKEGDNAGTI